MIVLAFDPCHTAQNYTLCIKALLQETDKIMKPYDMEAWCKQMKLRPLPPPASAKNMSLNVKINAYQVNYLVSIYFHTPSTLAVAFLKGKLGRHGTNGCESGRGGGLAIMPHKYALDWTSCRVS